MIKGKKIDRLIKSIVRILSSCEQDALSELMYLLKDYLMYESALILNILDGKELYSDSGDFDKNTRRKIISECSKGIYFDGIIVSKAPTYQIFSYRLSDDMSFPFVLTLKFGNRCKVPKDIVLILRLVGLGARLQNAFGFVGTTYIDSLSCAGTRDALHLYLEKEAPTGNAMVWWEMKSYEEMCRKFGVEKVQSALSTMLSILSGNFQKTYRISVGGFVALCKQNDTLYDICSFVQKGMDVFLEEYGEYQTAALVTVLQKDYIDTLHVCEKKIRTVPDDSVLIIHNDGLRDDIYEQAGPTDEEVYTADATQKEAHSDKQEENSAIVYEVWDDE